MSTLDSILALVAGIAFSVGLTLWVWWVSYFIIKLVEWFKE